jgi:hypothetical protein
MVQNLNFHTEDWKSESRKESDDGSIEAKGLKDRSVNSDDIFLSSMSSRFSLQI